jgi:hypothetical protein
MFFVNTIYWLLERVWGTDGELGVFLMEQKMEFFGYFSSESHLEMTCSVEEVKDQTILNRAEFSTSKGGLIGPFLLVNI